MAPYRTPFHYGIAIAHGPLNVRHPPFVVTIVAIAIISGCSVLAAACAISGRISISIVVGGRSNSRADVNPSHGPRVGGKSPVPLFVVDAVDLGKDQKAHARYRQQKAVHEFKDVYGTPAVVVDHQDAIQQQDERHGEEDLEDHRLKDSAGVGNVLPYLAGLVGHPDGNALAQEPHGRSGGVESHVGGVAELVLVALFDGVRFFRIARIQRDFPRPMGRGHNGLANQNPDLHQEYQKEGTDHVVDVDGLFFPELADPLGAPELAKECHVDDDDPNVEEPHPDDAQAIVEASTSIERSFPGQHAPGSGQHVHGCQQQRPGANQAQKG
mmetsp:Transcript_2741/g.5905  ORF Transcript_2741/g.5905 Transcript_2741/m.5905 type:complete len:326 (+) Transcript_2741:473-1450(+)